MTLRPSDLAETIDVADAIRALRDAVTPNIHGARDATDGHVESLTEAVMGMTAALVQIAEGLHSIAGAVQELRD
jgi:hypothetical protein